MKNIIKKILWILLGIVVALVVIGAGFWLIDGRSPQAFIVSHLLTKSL